MARAKNKIIERESNKVIRSSESNCLLCVENKAIKTNSHIIPKFMTKSMLGAGTVKKAFAINSGKADKAPQVSQDTVKEDFILCESCEQYFSVLETYIATRLNNRLRDIRYSSQFSKIENEHGVVYKVCEQINSIIFRLLIYSIVWRCNISSTDLCDDFSLFEEEAEHLRKALLKCKFLKQQELLDKIDLLKQDFPLFPFVFFTTEVFLDSTKNVLFAHPDSKNPYYLILNEYMLIFSFEKNELQRQFGLMNNFDETPIKIGFLPVELWESLRTQFLTMVAQNSLTHLKKSGRTPWLSPHGYINS